MIQIIDSPYNTRKADIKKYKLFYISSNELVYKGIDVLKLRKICDKHPQYHSICFNISGTFKYWFDRNTLAFMLRDTNQYKEFCVFKGD